MSDLPPAIFLMGPTAAGKPALALALHDTLPVEIISVDSSQVYRGMDIGTAKPTRDELARAPHRLIDSDGPVRPVLAPAELGHGLLVGGVAGQVETAPLLAGGT